MSGKESRKHKRLEVGGHRLNATLAIIDANKVTGCLVPLKDFSKSGAGIYVKFKVEGNTEVRISLEGLNFAPLEGVVVWCGSSAGDPQAPPTHPFRLGIDFRPKDDTERDNQIAVFNYVSKLVGETKE